jgi:hypothetical protein
LPENCGFQAIETANSIHRFTASFTAVKMALQQS